MSLAVGRAYSFLLPGGLIAPVSAVSPDALFDIIAFVTNTEAVCAQMHLTQKLGWKVIEVELREIRRAKSQHHP